VAIVISLWGGANTLAEALLRVRASRSADEIKKFVAKLRVYSISDQDDAGPWIYREFPDLFYIVQPSTPTGGEYYYATWTGNGDLFGRVTSRDTVVGVDGRQRVSDQATIWRWREAFQNDSAARMDWTIKDYKSANHNPVVTVNGRGGQRRL
jgi:hypothetical protein